MLLTIHTKMTIHTLGGATAVGWTVGIMGLFLHPSIYSSVEQRNFVSKLDRQSCYRDRYLWNCNSTKPIARHVGTPLLHTAHGSRPRGAREGCVADGVAIVAEDLSGLPRYSPQVVSQEDQANPARCLLPSRLPAGPHTLKQSYAA
jgi:hypothetical protein